IHEIVHRAGVEEHPLDDRGAEVGTVTVERRLESVEPRLAATLLVLRRKRRPVFASVIDSTREPPLMKRPPDLTNPPCAMAKNGKPSHRALATPVPPAAPWPLSGRACRSPR